MQLYEASTNKAIYIPEAAIDCIEMFCLQDSIYGIQIYTNSCIICISMETRAAIQRLYETLVLIARKPYPSTENDSKHIIEGEIKIIRQRSNDGLSIGEGNNELRY